MPLRELPADVQLDPAPAAPKLKPLPADAQLDAAPHAASSSDPIGKAVVAPLLNFADYPLRAILADLYAISQATAPSRWTSTTGQNPWEKMAAKFGGAVPTARTGPIDPDKFAAARASAMQASEIPENKVGQAVSRVLSYPGELLGKGVKAASDKLLGPELAHKLSPYATIAADVAPLAGAKVIAGTAGSAADLASAITTRNPAKVDSFIQRSFERAIKPSVAGKSTASQLAAYKDRAGSAIASIVENKANLRFTDPASGHPVVGELPKSIEQFGEAVEQTRQRIFQRYDAMAQAAGQQGARVTLDAAARELDKIAGSKTVQDFSPQISSYAESLAETLRKRGGYSAEEAQAAIQHLNQSLNAYYRNPTAEYAGRASVDAMVANQLRSGLDDAVEKAHGPGYQDLKNQYGALKTIEKDVIHRSVVEARKTTGSGVIGSIGDVASAEEVIRGALTLNPATIAGGAALKGAMAYLKYRRDPNRAVERLFKAADDKIQQINSPSAPRKVPPAAGAAIGYGLLPRDDPFSAGFALP